MATQDKSNEIKEPENVSSQQEQLVHLKQENEKVAEKKENRDDEVVSAELRREIEMMKLDPALDRIAEVQKEKIEYLGEKEKIEHLLEMAREKGLVYAVQVAKKMGDPYILDLLHDTLAREGFYLKIANANDDDSDNNSKT